jgi:hypothetical protein
MTARTVLLTDLESRARSLPPTLRGAVERLDALGGSVRVTDGRLDVRLPASEFGADQFGPKLGPRLARMLYAAEDVLLDAAKRKNGEIDASKAPDRPLLPSGALAP